MKKEWIKIGERIDQVDKKQLIRYNTLNVLYVAKKQYGGRVFYGRKEKHIDL